MRHPTPERIEPPPGDSGREIWPFFAPGTRHADVEARIITLRRVSNELTALTADLEDAAHALGRRQGARERRASPDCARG